jgi:hemoglobin
MTTQALNKDITTEADIKLMVDTFYEKVNLDDKLSPIFNDISKVDWEEHLPKMYRFWSSLIFVSGKYKGNPFAAHIPLPINGRHFERWIELFTSNIDEHFKGEVADYTKLRAKSIAHIFETKLSHIRGLR